jgi:hypothetical protein
MNRAVYTPEHPLKVAAYLGLAVLAVAGVVVASAVGLALHLLGRSVRLGYGRPSG